MAPFGLGLPRRPSNATVDYYVQRGEQLRSDAMYAAAASLGRGLVRLFRQAWHLAAATPHRRVWRVPGSGNCLNC